MGSKLALLTGLAAGYVLGTKAGHDRYLQLRQAADAFLGSQTAKALEAGLREAWGTAQSEFPAVGGLGGARPAGRR
jgi:hypothetical protein